MAKARTYPPANRTAQWYETKYTRGTMPVIEKILLHTTETAGWPSYGGGTSAPTITYNPWLPAGQRWRQHNYLNTSARALQDPASTPVRENRDGVVQIEIICYCDPKSYRKYGHAVTALPATAYEDLGAFVAFMHKEWGVPLARTANWSVFPPPSSIRMSSAAYDQFKGLLGHQHAPGNDHGDPGMTPAQVDRILAVARRMTGAPSGSTPSPPKETTLSAAEVQQIITAVTASEKRTQQYIEARLDAYFTDMKRFENQTDTADAARAAAAVWAHEVAGTTAAGAIAEIKADVDGLGKA